MKSVLVTGGVARLGKAIADALRTDGWRVLTASHRRDAGADVVADFRDSLGPARAYAEAVRLLGGVPPDALVNNAALFVGDDADIAAVNAEAPMKLTRMMAGREFGRGAVVNILDSRILGGCCGDAGAYEASKTALLNDTRRAAALFADVLRVNAVAPGPVMPPTDFHEKAGETPLGRPRPEDVSACVVYLLKAHATTGAVVPVDGGQHLLDFRA